MTGKLWLRQIRNNKGFAIVWLALSAIALLGMVALAVDLGFAYVISNELKTIADATALEAARTYISELRIAAAAAIPPDYGTIAATIAANVNGIANNTLVVNNGVLGAIDPPVINYGVFTDNNRAYNEDGSGGQFVRQGGLAATTNAFQIVIGRANSPTFFAGVLGFGPFAQVRNSVSMMAPRNFLLTIDTSGSMDDLSGLQFNLDPVADPFPWPDNRAYVKRPRIVGDATTPQFSAHAQGPAGTGLDPKVTPEPLQTVLNSSLAFLDGLVDQAFVSDQASVVYFSQTARSKINIIPLTRASVDPGGQFQTLLSNQVLYGNLNWQAVGGYYTLPAAMGASFEPDLYQSTLQIAIPLGSTNMGAAINRAMLNVQAAAGLSPRSTSIIILLTDGIPTCSALNVCHPGSPPNAADRAASRAFTLAQAQAAINNGVLVVPVSFTDLRPFPQELAMLNFIARLSGLTDLDGDGNEHFNIPPPFTPAQLAGALTNIFNFISTLVPFVLVG